MSDESVCQRCNGFNPVWTAPSPLWNYVMRGGSIDGIEVFSVVCPSCFVILARERGIDATGWRFQAMDVTVELETVTPTGRVWNPETWMFEEKNE